MRRFDGVAALFAALLAGQAHALDAGERAFRKCYACHAIEPAEAGKRLTGPWLGGVVGRPAAALENFQYSAAMRAAGSNGLVWTPETLDAFVADPPAFVPGTAMGFVRMQDGAERAALIEYLQRHSQ